MKSNCWPCSVAWLTGAPNGQLDLTCGSQTDLGQRPKGLSVLKRNIAETQLTSRRSYSLRTGSSNSSALSFAHENRSLQNLQALPHNLLSLRKHIINTLPMPIAKSKFEN